MEVWTTIILPIISGLVACIPLVIKLIDVSRKAIKEKNWAPLMQLIMRLVQEAEANYSTGADKKQYVLSSIEALEGSLNYDVDMKVVEEMLEAIVDTTKKVNINKK